MSLAFDTTTLSQWQSTLPASITCADLFEKTRREVYGNKNQTKQQTNLTQFARRLLPPGEVLAWESKLPSQLTIGNWATCGIENRLTFVIYVTYRSTNCCVIRRHVIWVANDLYLKGIRSVSPKGKVDQYAMPKRPAVLTSTLVSLVDKIVSEYTAA
jgi:hypothetical protein